MRRINMILNNSSFLVGVEIWLQNVVNIYVILLNDNKSLTYNANKKNNHVTDQQ